MHEHQKFQLLQVADDKTWEQGWVPKVCFEVSNIISDTSILVTFPVYNPPVPRGGWKPAASSHKTPRQNTKQMDHSNLCLESPSTHHETTFSSNMNPQTTLKIYAKAQSPGNDDCGGIRSHGGRRCLALRHCFRKAAIDGTNVHRRSDGLAQPSKPNERLS